MAILAVVKSFLREYWNSSLFRLRYLFSFLHIFTFGKVQEGKWEKNVHNFAGFDSGWLAEVRCAKPIGYPVWYIDLHLRSNLMVNAKLSCA